MRVAVPLALVMTTWTLPVSGQEPQSVPQKKGIFALLDKVSGKEATSSSKRPLPPRPPALRKAAAQHAQRTYTSMFGRSYILTNFKDQSASARSESEATLSAKNGFKGYTFGMSMEDFVAEARKRGEKFHPSKDMAFEGRDFRYTTPVDEQRIGEVPVKVVYAFFKGHLARISVSPHEAHADLTAKELQGLYEAFAATYGPGEEKTLVARAWSPTAFTGCDELVREDGLHKAMSTLLAEQQARGGFRPDQLGENLTYTGYFWVSDKVEVNLCTSTDLEELKKSKAGIWAQGTAEHSFSLSLSSRAVLGPYLAEQLKGKTRATSTSI